MSDSGLCCRCPPDRATANFSKLGTVGASSHSGRHFTPETEAQLALLVEKHCSTYKGGCSVRVVTTGCVVEGFESNCRLFGSFDLLVAAHGAALANLWCARPGAAVIEIVLYQGATMWVPLIRQLGLCYCAVTLVRNRQASMSSDVSALLPVMTPCLFHASHSLLH